MEFWLPCKGYEGLYEVSDTGLVKSLDRTTTYVRDGKIVAAKFKGRLLAFSKTQDGYNQAVLTKDGDCSTFRVHRIVAEAFIPNPLLLPQVNHKDGDKANNVVSNLEWCTGAENIQHAFATGLCKAGQAEHNSNFKGIVLAYRNGILVAELKGSADMVAKGFEPRGVSAVFHGKQKTHRGCTFVKLDKEI